MAEKDKKIKKEQQNTKNVKHAQIKMVLSQPSNTLFSMAFPATVEEVIGKTGMRGEVTQIRCKILDGRDSGKILRRNVKGPIRVEDVLMLRETEIESRKLTQGRK